MFIIKHLITIYVIRKSATEDHIGAAECIMSESGTLFKNWGRRLNDGDLTLIVWDTKRCWSIKTNFV